MSEVDVSKLITVLQMAASRHYDIPLEQSYDALVMVIKFVEDVGTSEAHQGVEPLSRLRNALSDRLKGADPELLRKPASINGRPKGTSYAIVPGVVAACMQALMTSRLNPMDRATAARHVAERASHYGLRDRKKERITAQQVASWRDRAGGDLGDVANDVFSRLTKGDAADLEVAKALIEQYLHAAGSSGFSERF